MFKYSFHRSLKVIPLLLIFMLFTTFIWDEQYLIVPASLKGFVNNLEVTLPVLLLVLYSFILHDTYEIELSLVCGVNTAELAFSKAIPLFLYTLASAALMIVLYRYLPFESLGNTIVIPIHIPDNYKLYLIVSVFVTVIFFSALFLFIRILVRNCYIPIGVGFFIYYTFSNLNISIHEGTKDIRLCIIDPFISTYFLGDTVPNAYAEQEVGFEIMKNAWTCNRLLFLVVAIILIWFSYVLLCRENLHKTFGD